MTMDEKIFMKIISDDLNELCFNYVNFNSYSQKIKSSAMIDGGLKTLSVRFRSNIINYVDDIKNLVSKFAIKKNLTNKTFKEQLELMIDAVEKFKSEISIDQESYENIDKKVQISYTANVNRYNRPVSIPIYEIVNGFRKLIKSCNHNINFINTAYNVRPDPRFGDTSTKRLFTSEMSENYYEYNPEFNWRDIDNMEKEMAEKNVEMFSPENGKLVAKKMRAFKADVISTMNKYFGQSTVFSEFNIPDLVLL